MDKISHLPNEVMVKILSCLTLTEAVRTSVLSSKWKYKSAMLPDLVFDEKRQTNALYVKIVDHVLLVHIGPIPMFKLSNRDVLLAPCDIDRWIIHLSRNSIKKVVLDIFRGHDYNIPSCLFSCQDIVHLELFGCKLLNFPSTFKGFKSLKNLDFESVTVAQDLFDKLIGCSPLLERLTLRDCDGFSNLLVNAPNLQYIGASDAFENVNIENALQLADFSIDLRSNVEWVSAGSNSSNLLKVFDNVPHIQMLTVGSKFISVIDFMVSPSIL